MSEKSKTECIRALAKTDELRLQLASFFDKAEAAAQKSYLTHTKFVSPAVRALCLAAAKQYAPACPFVFWGGYAEAERGIFLFYPDYLSEQQAILQAPLSALTVSAPAALSHRDYLGAMLGLGIDRAMTGDILVADRRADLVVLQSIAPFLQSDFVKVGRYGISVSLGALSALSLPENAVKSGSGTVAAPRLDSLLSLLFGISRSAAKQQIEGGLVLIDGLPCEKPEHLLQAPCLLTLRGHGRARLLSLGGQSRKGRIFAEFARYV